MTSDAVIVLYNRMTAMVVGRRKRTYARFDTKTRDAALKLIAFTDKEEIPLAPYVAGCFAKHSWAYQPAFTNLQADTYLEHYQGDPLAAAWWAKNLRREREADQTPDVPIGREIVKRRMLDTGGPDFCMAQSYFTGGHNPHSPLCQECSGREACKRG